MPGTRLRAHRTAAKKKKQTRKTEWYSGKLYLTGQPFRTFLTEAGFRERKFLFDRIHSVVSHPEKTSALEIGPGTNPILTDLPFKEKYFMDSSIKLARDLKTRTGEKVVIGDARKLPFSSKEKFGLVLMNEVLTHITPSERVKTIINISKASNSIVILDRKQVSLREIISKERINAAAKLELLAGFKGKSTAKTRKTIITKVNLKTMPSSARTIQAQTVNFNPIKSALEKNNWQTELQDIESRGIKYTVLTATKRK